MNIRDRINQQLTNKKSAIEFLTIPNTLIISAVVENNLEEVKNLYKQTSEDELIDALWIAAAHKKLAILIYLIQCGVDPNTKSTICKQHSYPIQIAVSTPNNYQCILYLLTNNVDVNVKTISGNYLWQLAIDEINRNLIFGFIHFNKALQEFYDNNPFANLAFLSALFANPKFVFDQLAIMVAATNAIENNASDNDENYEPLFLQFAIKQLTLFAETKPEVFEDNWLRDEVFNLSLHLNAYNTASAAQNPYALFKNVKQKMHMLRCYEMNTGFGERKTQFNDLK